MGQGISAFGTTFQWNGNPLAELTSIGGPTISMDTIDVSSHDSADAFREFIGGMGDGGEVSLEGNLYPGDTPGQVALLDDMLDRQVREIIITFPDGTTFTCDALATAFEPSAPFEDKLSFSATVKLTGKPVFGVGLAAALTALALTTGTLNPVFGGTTYEYVAPITGATFTVTPTSAAADSITVNGNVVVSGNPSSAISAGNVGDITEVVVKTFDAGTSARIYRIHCYRAS